MSRRGNEAEQTEFIFHKGLRRHFRLFHFPVASHAIITKRKVEIYRRLMWIAWAFIFLRFILSFLGYKATTCLGTHHTNGKRNKSNKKGKQNRLLKQHPSQGRYKVKWDVWVLRMQFLSARLRWNCFKTERSKYVYVPGFLTFVRKTKGPSS